MRERGELGVGSAGDDAAHQGVGAGARVAAAAGVHTDIPAGETWAGVPAQPIKGFQRQLRALRRIAMRGHVTADGGSSDE